MRALFLDLAHHDGSVACVTETATIVRRAVDKRLRDDGLLPLIEETLAAAGWRAEDLTHLACVTGPGGFTSLRVAVAAANALAWERGIPVKTIHGSDLWVARSLTPDAVWLHSTRQDQLFARGLGALASLCPEPALRTITELLAIVPAGSSFLGELIEPHAQALASLKLQPAGLRPIEEVLPALLAAAPEAPAPVDPWYGRGY
ncbi:MAG: tRNA (adenosine(37)-N6)-threonylcarbamoyltransferase complex dimerization subunit type 1 TsaB [Candidatus Peribacteraceae bacterium]|nr:tRNA (adenosine(37)-N6)-threonylcarbamoyltransferase complex dimerization subunit type 1 TsaB [Candidatus Peribacteraceae bacterium]